MVRKELVEYLDANIREKYRNFAKGHSFDHVHKVICEIMDLAKEHGLDMEYCFTIAMYHDIGLEKGRVGHEKASANYMRNDENLLSWFSDEEIELMAQAVEDHRSSLRGEPRSKYGKAISEADRDLNPTVLISKYAEMSKRYGMSIPHEKNRVFGEESCFERMWEELNEKYGEGGYFTLWMNSRRNLRDWCKLREMLDNKERARGIYTIAFNS